MAEPAKTSGAIIPMGSQLSDPVAAGQAAANAAGATTSADPFAGADWLTPNPNDQSMDADPINPGVDVFGSNIQDVPSQITLPNDSNATVQAGIPAAGAAITQPMPDNVLSPVSTDNVITPTSVPPVTESTAPLAPVDSMSGGLPSSEISPVMPDLPSLGGFAGTPAPIAVDAQTLAAAAQTPESSVVKSSLNKLADQVVSPKTRRNLSLVVIFVLLILVVVLSSALIFNMLRGGVNVTINAGGSGNIKPNVTSGSGTSSQTVTSTTTSSEPTTSSGTTSSTPTGNETSQNLNAYFWLLTEDLPAGSDPESLPEGAIQASGGYLIKTEIASNVSTDQPAVEALKRLFDISQDTYGDAGYKNKLVGNELFVEFSLSGDEQFPTLEINLLGTLNTNSSATDLALAKQQIDFTVQLYTFNYKITLNGSEETYQNLGQ